MDENRSSFRNIYRSVFFTSLITLTLVACGSEVVVHNPDGGANPPVGNNPDPAAPDPGTTDPGTTPDPGTGVVCGLAKNGDPCATPGDWCSTYDADNGEFCDAWCSDDGTWNMECYSDDWQDDGYCYQPEDLCPNQMPVNGSVCGTTSDCQYYDCEYSNVCDGGGWAFAYCEYGTWWVESDCGDSGSGGNGGG